MRTLPRRVTRSVFLERRVRIVFRNVEAESPKDLSAICNVGFFTFFDLLVQRDEFAPLDPVDDSVSFPSVGVGESVDDSGEFVEFASGLI